MNESSDVKEITVLGSMVSVSVESVVLFLIETGPTTGSPQTTTTTLYPTTGLTGKPTRPDTSDTLIKGFTCFNISFSR